MLAESPLFAKSDEVVRQTYARLIEALREIGPAGEDEKQTCIHLTAGENGTAFAGVHPRRSAILLNLRTAAAIESPRIRKREQASRNRWHNELLVASPDEVDAELVGWLREAYALSSPSPA